MTTLPCLNACISAESPPCDATTPNDARSLPRSRHAACRHAAASKPRPPRHATPDRPGLGTVITGEMALRRLDPPATSLGSWPPRRRRGPAATAQLRHGRLQWPASAPLLRTARPQLQTMLAPTPTRVPRLADAPQRALQNQHHAPRHATPRLAVTALATSSRARWPCVHRTSLRPH